MENKIKNLIIEYVKNYPDSNNVKTGWKEPLVAYADAQDKEFKRLKDIISPSHALPQYFLADAKTVITYFLPFTETVANCNIEGKTASKEWAIAYVDTNKLILDINKYMDTKLKELGYNSAIIPATHNFDEDKLISDWSHRHVAYIAGLGKFGLNNMLITEKGCCGRVGSIVTNLKLRAGERPSNEYCLYKENGSCKKCVYRCVNSALSSEKFNRHKCYEMCLYNDKIYDKLGLVEVCGKCLVDVPCSFTNPLKN